MAVKNAVAKTWSITPSADGKKWSAWPDGDKPAADPQTGLTFLENSTTGSDIRLNWTGADLLPRTSHTAIWKANYIQQTGYYAVVWHTSNDGTWHASAYEYGTHPHPCSDDAVDGNGQRQNGTGASGTDHWQEIAGLGAFDFIASPSSPGPQTRFPVTKGVWVSQARTCEIVNISGTDYLEHTFYPDLSAPTTFIRQRVLLSTYTTALASTVSPAFIIGCSPWTVSGSVNSETPRATLRGIKLFDEALSAADIVTESESDSNTPATSAGLASVWYTNINPTPTDVSDKSGAGHSPAWANANRPTLWEA